MGLEWLQNHFESSQPEKTRLLCDNHSSHDNCGFYEHFLTNNIALLFFPSHAAYILQPLDVSVFSPLDHYCGRGVVNWTASQPLPTSLLRGAFLTCVGGHEGRVQQLTTSTQHDQNAVSIHSIKRGLRPIPTILFSFRYILSPHHHEKGSNSYRAVLELPLLKSKNSRLRYQQLKDRLKSSHSEVLLLGPKLS